MKLKPWLEPILQNWRIYKVINYIPKGGVLVDIGCDETPVLINRIKYKMKKCIGVDIVVKDKAYDNVEIKHMDLQKKIKLGNNTANVITILAVLEHMKFPQEILSECFRVLKPGGVILITVPSPMNKPLVEFFGKIGLIRQEMVDQHENYFTQKALAELLDKAGFKQVQVSLFELGLNTFARAVK